MNELNKMRQYAGIINESRYGNKFDNFKTPFKNDGKKIYDGSGNYVCECSNIEFARELAHILSDIRKMREICEKFMTLPKN